jgi:hypothetical protein
MTQEDVFVVDNDNAKEVHHEVVSLLSRLGRGILAGTTRK